MLFYHRTSMLITSMATSLTKIADSLVPEDQRTKPDKKVDEEDDDEFKKQIELAIKLSLNEKGRETPEPKSTPKSKKNKFKKVRDTNPISKPSTVQNAKTIAGGTMFSTNDVTELSFEEQLQLVQARSKFDTVDIFSTSPESVPDEEDLLQIAIQKSTDPSEQIDLDNRLLFEAIKASKADANLNSFLDSDASSSTSSSVTSYRPSSDIFASTSTSSYNLVLPSTNHRRKNDITSARKRGGGGTNRPLSDQPKHFSFEPDNDEDLDEDVKLAIKLSLQANSGFFNRQCPPNNSYSAAASKLTSSTSLPSLKVTNSRNVYADPLKIISNPNPARPCPGMRRRPIIVDGCNVAFQHGKNDRYSAKGLLLVYQYFVTRHGYTNSDITIINKFSKNLNDEDRKIVESLYKMDVLIYSPSRLVGGRLISSDDDLFVLNLAKEKNGVVVSLDQFRDAYSKTRDREIKEVIKHRILQFAFKGDEVFFPPDPLGPSGPTLEEFLKY